MYGMNNMRKKNNNNFFFPLIFSATKRENKRLNYDPRPDQDKKENELSLSLSLAVCPGIFFHLRRRFLKDFFHGLNKFWCGPHFKIGPSSNSCGPSSTGPKSRSSTLKEITVNRIFTKLNSNKQFT